MNQSLLQHTNMTRIFLNDMTVSKVIRKWIESPQGILGSIGGIS